MNGFHFESLLKHALFDDEDQILIDVMIGVRMKWQWLMSFWQDCPECYYLGTDLVPVQIFSVHELLALIQKKNR